MSEEIDNFDLVRDRVLEFSEEGEFYMVMVLRRRKDISGIVQEGVNEDNRLIKHYFVYDKEYLERKRGAIKSLCMQNNARAYILPQRRTCNLVLWGLHDKVSETLKSGAMNVHFDHLIRSCVAGMHETPVGKKWHKRWLIDIDRDSQSSIKAMKNFTLYMIANDKWDYYKERGNTLFNPGDRNDSFDLYAHWLKFMLECALVANYSGNKDSSGCNVDDRKTLVPRSYDFMPKVYTGYRENDIVVLPTPHGFHIVTPPFNRDASAMNKYLFGCEPSTDMIKPDAMALLYSPFGG